MALELLSGPADIAVDGTAVSGFGLYYNMMWVHPFGLISMDVTEVGGATGTYVAQLDGTTFFRSLYVDHGPLILDLRIETRGLATFDGSNYYHFDPIAAAPYVDPFLAIGSSATAATFICEDRFIRVNWDQVLSSPITDGLNYTLEYTFSGAPTGGVTVSKTNRPEIVCIAWLIQGEIRFYDIVNRVQFGPTQYVGEEFDGCWYIPKWDLFLELTDKQLKVLANAVRPDTISNPVALSAVKPGVITQVQVRVLGAQSEPCVGELVNWSISAGDGSVDPPQSATDENGYAQTGYLCPNGGSGSVSINADVNF